MKVFLGPKLLAVFYKKLTANGENIKPWTRICVQFYCWFLAHSAKCFEPLNLWVLNTQDMHNITSFINTFESYEQKSATEVLDHYITKILYDYIIRT